MVIKVLLLLPFLPGILMHGVVSNVGVMISGDETPVHTWYQQDPVPSKLLIVYKLECAIPKTSKDMFTVRVYYQDQLLETLTATRFNDELLKSVTVLRRDKQGRHRIRYKMTENSGAPCKLRLYEPNKKKGFSATDADCGSWLAGKIWNRGGQGWKWDVDAIAETPPRGVVGQTGLLKYKETGELMHTWSHKLKGYKLIVRRLRNTNGDTYLATVVYRGASLDVVEVFSLGEDLTRSITIMGPEKGAQVVQYQKTDDHCQRLNYKVSLGEKQGRQAERKTGTASNNKRPEEKKVTKKNSGGRQAGENKQVAKRHWSVNTEDGDKPKALIGTVGMIWRTTDKLEYKDVVQPPVPLRCKTQILKKLSFVFKKLFVGNDSGNGWIW